MLWYGMAWHGVAWHGMGSDRMGWDGRDEIYAVPLPGRIATDLPRRSRHRGSRLRCTLLAGLTAASNWVWLPRDSAESMPREAETGSRRGAAACRPSPMLHVLGLIWCAPRPVHIWAMDRL